MSQTKPSAAVRGSARTPVVSGKHDPSDAWEQSWQAYWSKADLPGHELPRKAVDLILKSIPSTVRDCLEPAFEPEHRVRRCENALPRVPRKTDK